LKFEKHGLDELTDDLDRATRDIRPQVAKVTGMGLNNIKKDVAKRWSGLPHLPHLPRSLGYDVTTRPAEVDGEVGALHERPQGKLAWIPEYGSPTSAPRPGFAPATDKEVPVWMTFLEKVAADAVDNR
jgi:hypothetical protein